MKLPYPRLAFAILISALGISSVPAQSAAPRYKIVDLNIGNIPWAVASNGIMVIDRVSPTGSPYRYRAGNLELLGDANRAFSFRDMNDAGDIVGVGGFPAEFPGTAYAILATNPSNSLTQWAQTGQHTPPPQSTSSGSGLQVVNELVTVTGFEFSAEQVGKNGSGEDTSFISSFPFSLGTISSSSYVCNPDCTYSGESYFFRDLNNVGGGVGMKHVFTPPARDAALYYNLASTPFGDRAFKPYAVNDDGLVAGLSNNEFKLWEPALGAFREFPNLPNVTEESIRITNSSNEGGAIRVTDAPFTEPQATTFILAGNNLITRGWMDASGTPSSTPVYTVFGVSDLIPANFPYVEVALKYIANNGLIAATARSLADNSLRTLLLIPPNVAVSYLKENDLKWGGDEDDGCGMAQFSAHALQASLHIKDTPLRYSPPRGPAISFTITYNQREKRQLTAFDYANLGPNWTFNWHSYLVDDPAVQALITTVYVPGGGAEIYTFDHASQTFAPDPQSHATLVRNGSTYEKVFPDGSKHVYGWSDGATTYPRRMFLTQMVDAIGNPVTIAYFPQTTKIDKIIDPLNQETNFFYADPADPYKITKVTDPFARSALLGYDKGRLISVTDPVGIVSGFTYKDRTNFIEYLTTPYRTMEFTTGESGTSRWLNMIDTTTGATERVEYRDNTPEIPAMDPAITVPSGYTNVELDKANTFYWDKKATQMHPPVGGVYDYTKARITHWARNAGGDVSGIVASERAPLEYRVWRKYQGQIDTNHTGPSGNPTEVARVLGDNSTQRYQYQYNTLGNRIRAIDPEGRVTYFEYAANDIDLVGVLQKNPAGWDRSPDNEPADRLLWITYNDSHQPLSVQDTIGGAAYTYTSLKQIETVTNARGETTTYGYGDGSTGHPVGYLTSITSPEVNGVAASTTFSYDAARRVHKVTSIPDGYMITNEYDDLDRPTQITYPDNTTEQFQYTDSVRGMTLDLTASKDRLNRWTYRHYNSDRNMDSIVDDLTQTTYEWCTCGSLNSITDPNGNMTIFNRDLQGRVHQKIFQDTRTINYLYEGQSAPNTSGATSRLKSASDALNRRTNYAYFKDDNIQSTSYTDTLGNPLSPATSTVSYTYDLYHNRIATMNDGTGETIYTFNPIGKPFWGNDGTLRSVDGPLDGDIITFVHDELGRKISQTIEGGQEATMSYDALGRITTSINALGEFGRTYDGPTSRLDTLTYPNGQTTVYTYFDNIKDRRLQTLENLYPNTSNLSKFDYDYIAGGQITSWQRQLGLAGSGRWFVYDEIRRLLSARNHSSPTSATEVNSYGYDDAGNRTSDSIFNPQDPKEIPTSRSYTPNNLNQIETIDINYGMISWQVMLAYDSAGNLLDNGEGKTFEWDAANRLRAIDHGSGQRSEFNYDGLNRRVKIVEKTGSTVTSTKHFVWVGNTIAQERDGNNEVTRQYFAEGEQRDKSYYYTRDHLGSIRELTDIEGTLLAQYDYDPYGQRTKMSGTGDVDFGYTGHYHHAPSGLNLTLYRAYNPAFGRWLSRDPIGERGGLNLYGYVGNQPINFRDPLGLEPSDEWWDENQGTLGTARGQDAALRAQEKVRQGVSHSESYLSAILGLFTRVRTKPVSLPAESSLSLNLTHIASGHMQGGSRVSSLKTLFPSGWSTAHVEKAVRDAYKCAKKMESQGDRVRVRGATSEGLTVEMWVNTSTKMIETAYPIP
jgi:RHS repeat-associated protein